jgi:hypothetical protein
VTLRLDLIDEVTTFRIGMQDQRLDRALAQGLGKAAALCALSCEGGVRCAAMRWLALPLAALIKASMSFVEINRRRLRLDRHGSCWSTSAIPTPNWTRSGTSWSRT